MGGGERAQWAMKRAVSPVSNERCKQLRSSATIANCEPGRVGSRRDPTKQKTMHCMVFCFVRIPTFTYSPRTLPVNARSALDLKHDGAARCQWQSKRRGGTVSSGVLGSRFSGDAKRRLRTGRRVGSRRDPTKQKTMHCMVFCFVRIPTFTYSPEPCQSTREAHLT